MTSVALTRGLDEMKESAVVSAQTAAVLKSTGGAAGVTAGDVENLAGKLSAMSGVDDEAIQSGENLLLTFKNIRNTANSPIFDRATAAALDMSVALGKDLNSSAQVVGRALNQIADGQIPKSIRGLGKLTKAQVAQMTAMQKAGDVAGAQAVVLDALEKSYGGSAKAAGETLPGQLAKLNNAFDELAGKGIGKAFEELKPIVEGIGTVLGTLAPILQPLGQLLVDNLLAPFKALAALLTGDFSGALDALKAPIEDVRNLLGGVWDVVGPPLEKVADYFVKLPGRVAGTLGDLASTALSPFKSAFQTASTFVGDRVDDVVGFFTKLPGRLVAGLTAVGSTILAPFKTAWNTASTFVGDRVDDVVGFFTKLPGRLLAGLTAFGSTVAQPFKTAWQGIATFVGDRVDDVVGFFTAMPGRIGALASSAYNAALRFAGRLFDGIVDGLKAVGGWLARNVIGPINAFIDAWNGLSIPYPTVSIEHKSILGVDFPYPSFGVGYWNPPNIPRLADGGIVNRATLAVIGEAGPEAVIPLDRAGMGGVTVNVTVNGALLGSSVPEVAQTIRRELLRVQARNGTLGFT